MRITSLRLGANELRILANPASRYNPGMYARRFESLLAGEVGKTDLSHRAPDDMPQRFESLRGYPSPRESDI